MPKIKNRKTRLRKMQTVSANLRIATNAKGGIRRDKMGGREYLVCKMVMLTEGVHEGNNGPLYYPDNELADIPERWNHKPVVINHPTDDDGESVSACTKESITKYGVGVIMNTQYDDDKRKLRAEAWLIEDRLKMISPDTYRAIVRNKVVEVSTGLFSDNIAKSGRWNGERFIGIARNYKPDHLAILTDGKGACSIADGAGLLQLNKAKERPDVVQIGDEVYRMPQRQNTNSKKKVKPMALSAKAKKIQKIKTAVINKLVANKKSGFDEGDRDGLLKMKLSKLRQFEANAAAVAEKAAKKDEEEQDGEEEEVSTKTTKETKETKETEEKPATKNKEKKEKIAFEDLPESVQETVKRAEQIVNAEKNRYIKLILANKGNVLSEKQLKAMKSEQLQGIAALCRNSKTVASSDEDEEEDEFDLDFSGRGFEVNAGDDEDEDDDDDVSLYLPPSTFNAEKYAKKK